MKLPLLPVTLWCALSAVCLAEPPAPLTGKDIVDNVKLVVRADKGEKLTEDETGRVQLMVAYLKGFTDGLHPMQILYPQSPVFIPETETIGQFARHLDEYLATDKDALTDNSSLAIFNCAFLYYKNPNFDPALMPKRVTVPGLTPKK